MLKKHVLGIEEIKFTKDRLCVLMKTTRPLELLHTDLFGPPTYSSFGGFLYGLVIVYDFSQYTWVHFLVYKSETQGVFKRFAQRVMNNYDIKIKHIQSDNGTEFKNAGL